MIEILKMFGVFLGITTTIIAPLLWFVKQQSARNEKLSNNILEEVKKTGEKNHKDLKEQIQGVRDNVEKDMKSSQVHFDINIDKIHNIMEERDKDMKSYINSNINDIKAFIADIELKIDETNKENNRVEKDLLTFQTEVAKHYVSHSQLDKIIGNNPHNQNKKD